MPGPRWAACCSTTSGLSHDGGVLLCIVPSAGQRFLRSESIQHGNQRTTDRHATRWHWRTGTYYVNGAAFWDERAGSLEEQALIPIESPKRNGLDAQRSRGEAQPDDVLPGAVPGRIRLARRDARADRQSDRAVRARDGFVPIEVRHGIRARLEAAKFRGRLHGGRIGGANRCFTAWGAAPVAIRPMPTWASRWPTSGWTRRIVDEGAGEGRFKTPSLRNVAVRGRFMHDGRFSTLQEVIEFYNSGVQDNPSLDQALRTIRCNSISRRSRSSNWWRISTRSRTTRS